jgi:hypothetical protein
MGERLRGRPRERSSFLPPSDERGEGREGDRSRAEGRAKRKKRSKKRRG